MKSSVLKVVASVSLACGVPVASAAVLDFDDLNSFAFFTAPYKGFTFGTNNIATSNWFYDNAAGFPFTSQSPLTNAGTDAGQFPPNSRADAQAITNPVDFRFDGAYFAGYNTVKITYKLSLDGNPVYTSAQSDFLSPTPRFLPSGYTGLVDSVVINGDQGFYAMDNFTYLPVPEPSTYALMAAGLGALGFFARRRKSV